MTKICIILYLVAAHQQCVPDAVRQQQRQLQTVHFTFNYTSLDDNNIHLIADSVENNWQRIITNLNVVSMPNVTVTFYDSPEALHDGVKKIIANVPLWSTGFSTSVSQIHMLSPNHPSQVFNGMLRNVIHEFAHCVTQKISPAFPNNPRWLWESVAVHQARQFVDPHRLVYMVNHTPPSFTELSSFSNLCIYDVGFLFTEFILQRWGSVKLTELIAAHGNTQSVLGQSQDDFYKDWFAFVKARYKV